MTQVIARAKAFSNDSIRTHKFEVDSDGTVRVWDSVAGYYTRCHNLSESAKKRIVKTAMNHDGADPA